MKKWISAGITLAAIVVVAILLRFDIFDKQNDWVCQSGNWIARGNPTKSAPLNASCKKDGTVVHVLQIDTFTASNLYDYTVRQGDELTHRFASCITVKASSTSEIVEKKLTAEMGTIELSESASSGKMSIFSIPAVYAQVYLCTPSMVYEFPPSYAYLNQTYFYYPPSLIHQLPAKDTITLYLKNAEGLEVEKTTTVTITSQGL